MHNKLKKLLAAVAAICLAGLLLAPAALAEEPAPGTVTLPAKLTLKGNLPASAGPYHFTLQAQDATNPMPAGAEGDTKTVTTAAPGALDFGSITFTNIGEYVYTVKQKPGTSPDCIYDNRIYTATVYVHWKAEVGGEVNATLVLATDAAVDKPAEVAFQNAYAAGEPTPTPPPSDGPTPTPKPEPTPSDKPTPTDGPNEDPPGTPTPTPAPVPGVTGTPPTSATLQAVLGLLPQTSDEAPLLLFAVLAAASLVVLAVLLLRKRRKNKNDPK